MSPAAPSLQLTNCGWSLSIDIRTNVAAAAVLAGDLVSELRALQEALPPDAGGGDLSRALALLVAAEMALIDADECVARIASTD